MRKILSSLAISLIFTVSGAVLAADEGVSVSAQFDKYRATVGDPVNYTVTLACPPDYKLTIPEKQDELGPWEVKEFKVFQEKKDKLYSYLNYTLAAFTTGDVIIPEISFQFTNSGNSPVTVRTSSAEIYIDSILSLDRSAPALKDIKAPLYLRVPAGVYILGSLAAVGLGAGAWFWYRKFQKNLPGLPRESAEPAIPPYRVALDELEKLGGSGLIEEGKLKEFYTALSDIVRRYLGAVYSIDTLDKTTGEIYQELRQNVPDKKALVAMKDFFEECDLVKFAKYKPDPKTAREDFEKAKLIIE